MKDPGESGKSISLMVRVSPAVRTKRPWLVWITTELPEASTETTEPTKAFTSVKSAPERTTALAGTAADMTVGVMLALMVSPSMEMARSEREDATKAVVNIEHLIRRSIKCAETYRGLRSVAQGDF